MSFCWFHGVASMSGLDAFVWYIDIAEHYIVFFFLLGGGRGKRVHGFRFRGLGVQGYRVAGCSVGPRNSTGLCETF